MGLRATSGIVKLRWPAQYELGRGGYYHVYRSAPDDPQNINFAASVNGAPIPAWPPEIEGCRMGDGLGPDGLDVDGYGWGGVGDGLGIDGYGPDGFDTVYREYLDANLADGVYGYAVVAYDETGNGDTENALTATVAVSSAPYPPASAQPTGYDEPTQTVTLEFTPDPRNRIG